MQPAALVAVLLSVAPSSARTPSCDDIDAAKTRVYGFRPTQLDAKARRAKAKAMDSFWELVKSKGVDGAACLKRLLAEERADLFFLFDGASLLLSLDGSGASSAVVAAAVLRADLQEIDPAGYLRVCLQLSRAGTDIGPLAVKYLRHPKEASVPEHFMTLDRFTAAAVLFGSMRPELVDRYAVPALSDSDSDDGVRAAAGMVLALNMTEESFRALHSFAVDSLPPKVRQEVLAFRTRAPTDRAGAAPKFSREQVLKVIRRIPHTEAEFEVVFREEQKQREEREKSEPKIDPSDTKARLDKMNRDIEESEPFLGIAGATRFLKSAALTLEERDLPEIRDARRKSLHGVSDESLHEFFAYTQIIEAVINRLDLYAKYRIH